MSIDFISDIGLCIKLTCEMAYICVIGSSLKWHFILNLFPKGTNFKKLFFMLTDDPEPVILSNIFLDAGIKNFSILRARQYSLEPSQDNNIFNMANTFQYIITLDNLKTGSSSKNLALQTPTPCLSIY